MKERIRQLRKALNLSQADFGKKVGVTFSTIGGYEQGRRNVSSAVFKSICREYNVNEEWLRTGKGEMFNKEEDTEDNVKLGGELYQISQDKMLLRFIDEYLKLSNENQSAIWNFIENLANKSSTD